MNVDMINLEIVPTMRRSPPLLPLLLCIFLAIPAVAHGQQPAAGTQGQQAEAMLKRAEQAYESLEYEDALRMLVQIQQIPDLTAIQKARTYLYMGVAFTALGRAENAVQAFSEVLKVRPEFRLPPGVSPSIRAMFAQALKRLNLPEQPTPGAQPQAGGAAAEGGDVSVEASASRKVAAGKPITIEIELTDPAKKTREILIHWRRRRGPEYSKIKLEYVPGAKEISGTIPAAALTGQGGNVVYYVEARDATGKTLATDGSEDDPHQVVLSDGQKKKKGTPNWVWWTVGVGGGVAAVAVAVLTGVLIANSGNGGDSANLTVVIE